MRRAQYEAFSYAQRRAKAGPNRLVTDAANMTAGLQGRALDIGAGSLVDTKTLLLAGRQVDAVDSDPTTARLAAEMNNPSLTTISDDIRNVVIDPGAYALVVAIHVLSFLPRADMTRVIESVRRGLVDAGVFCGTLFGERDGWAGKLPLVTFLNRQAALGLLEPFEAIRFGEYEFDGRDGLGRPKRWHVFRFIVRKRASRLADRRGSVTVQASST